VMETDPPVQLVVELKTLVFVMDNNPHVEVAHFTHSSPCPSTDAPPTRRDCLVGFVQAEVMDPVEDSESVLSFRDPHCPPMWALVAQPVRAQLLTLMSLPCITSPVALASFGLPDSPNPPQSSVAVPKRISP